MQRSFSSTWSFTRNIRATVTISNLKYTYKNSNFSRASLSDDFTGPYSFPVQDSILQMGGTDNELLLSYKEPSMQQQLETSGSFKLLLELWLLWQKSALLGTSHLTRLRLDLTVITVVTDVLFSETPLLGPSPCARLLITSLEFLAVFSCHFLLCCPNCCWLAIIASTWFTPDNISPCKASCYGSPPSVPSLC